MDIYTSSDILKWGDRIISDCADGDVVRIEYPNKISNMKTGKGGNTIGAHNETGRNATVTMRLIRGSADDKFFNTLLAQWKNFDDAFVPQSASFSKLMKDNDGNNITDTVDVSFGLPDSEVPIYENVEGDTEQAVAVYVWNFGRSQRSLG